MKYLNLVLVSIISIATIGCAPESNSEMTVEDARQAIEQVHGRYIDAVVAEDVEREGVISRMRSTPQCRLTRTQL